jgi:hypothetical protein
MSEKILEIKNDLYKKLFGLRNKIKYGIKAPEFGELIFIDPRNIESYLQSNNSRGKSGLVRSGDWDLEPLKTIENIPRYKFCKMHWVDNIPWKETGVYDYMLAEIERKGSVDGCLDLEDLMSRYERLDSLFYHLKETRQFKTQKELHPSNFNEEGGVLFHIGRDNQPIFAAGGMHRFSIAKILKLERIPAQLGFLHPDALEDWKIHKKRLN